MKAFVIAMLAGLGVATAAFAQAPTDEPAIRYSIGAWGRTMSEWRIEADGAGLRRASDSNAVSGDYTLTTRSFRVNADQLTRLARIIARLQRLADTDYTCHVTITDGDYGLIAWKRPAGLSKLSFNSGCAGAKDRQYRGWIADADRLVTGWAAAGELVRTQQVKDGAKPRALLPAAPVNPPPTARSTASLPPTPTANIGPARNPMTPPAAAGSTATSRRAALVSTGG